MLKTERKSRFSVFGSYAMSCIPGGTVKGRPGDDCQKIVKYYIVYAMGLRLEKGDGPPGSPYKDYSIY